MFFSLALVAVPYREIQGSVYPSPNEVTQTMAFSDRLFFPLFFFLNMKACVIIAMGGGSMNPPAKKCISISK